MLTLLFLEQLIALLYINNDECVYHRDMYKNFQITRILGDFGHHRISFQITEFWEFD